jgi:hypothetical protein
MKQVMLYLQCCKSLRYIADIPRYSKLNTCPIYPRYSEIFRVRPLSCDIFRDITIFSANVTKKLHSGPSPILSPRQDLQHCLFGVCLATVLQLCLSFPSFHLMSRFITSTTCTFFNRVSSAFKIWHCCLPSDCKFMTRSMSGLSLSF